MCKLKQLKKLNLNIVICSSDMLLKLFKNLSKIIYSNPHKYIRFKMSDRYNYKKTMHNFDMGINSWIRI